VPFASHDGYIGSRAAESPRCSITLGWVWNTLDSSRPATLTAMTDKDDLAGLRDLHKTIDAATEVLAAFLSAAASAELPSEALVDAAHKTCGDLAEWRETLKGLVQRDEGGHDVH
jgi:hypothetical protein